MSRDRWSAYATAAQKGAPQAMQVADRWHILRNLTESVSALFPQIRAELNQDRASTKTPSTSAAHESRKAQYLPVLALHQQGLSLEAIALQTGMSLSTIARWLKAGHVPCRPPWNALG